MNVINRQDAIEVYANDEGEVVIRQENPFGEEVVVWFSPEHAEKVANAILQIRAEIEKGE